MTMTRFNRYLLIVILSVLALAGCRSNGGVAGESSGVDVEQQDADGDGVVNVDDNCVLLSNPGQEDLDGDGIGDACDSDEDGDGVGNPQDDCPRNPAPGCSSSDADTDEDGIRDADDNCPAIPNPAQEDGDSDGVGDACEDTNDRDSDGAPDSEDNCPDTANNNQTDADGDGIGDLCDPDDNSDPATAYACGTAAAAPFKPFQSPDSAATADTSFLCLSGCVDNPENVVDSNFLNSATINVPLSLAGTVALSIVDNGEIYEGPNKLGLAIAEPDQLLNASLLSSLTVTTALDGAVQERFSDLDLADLDLLGLLNDGGAGFLVLDTAQDFNEVTVGVSGVNVFTQVDVMTVCASKDAL